MSTWRPRADPDSVPAGQPLRPLASLWLLLRVTLPPRLRARVPTQEGQTH